MLEARYNQIPGSTTEKNQFWCLWYEAKKRKEHACALEKIIDIFCLFLLVDIEAMLSDLVSTKNHHGVQRILSIF